MASIQGAAPKDGDRDRAAELIAITWSQCAVSIIFVALRFYSRTRLTGNLWYDDAFIIITLVLLIVTVILWTVLAVNNGCKHIYYLDSSELVPALRLSWITQTFAIAAVATGKISVAFLILRIMGKSTWRRRLLYFCIVSNSIFCSLAIIFTFVQCKPVEGLWDSSVKAECWKPKSQSSFSVFAGSWLAFTDAFLALLPISIIRALNIPIRKKIGLCTILGLGIFAAICAAIKTSELPKLDARGDFLWETVPLWIWTSSEMNSIIWAACIPTLRPLFLVLFNRPGSEAYRVHKGYQQQSPPSIHGHNRLNTDVRGLADNRIRQTIEMDVRYDTRSEERENASTADLVA